MQIVCQRVSKKYNKEVVFQGVQTTFAAADKVAIFGGNGSGKSTFLKVLAGLESPSEGSVVWQQETNHLSADKWYKHFTFCSPYIQLYDDLSLNELYVFYRELKPLIFKDFSGFFDALSLSVKSTKPLKEYSSGMRQRVKLLLAIAANVEVVFLDEPTSNLDVKGVKWYQQMVEKYASRKMVFVASNNEEQETQFCSRHLNILDFKSTELQ